MPQELKPGPSWQIAGKIGFLYCRFDLQHHDWAIPGIQEKGPGRQTLGSQGAVWGASGELAAWLACNGLIAHQQSLR